jgi:hypothetical protein
MAVVEDKPMFPEVGIVDNFAHSWFMQAQKKINVLGSAKNLNLRENYLTGLVSSQVDLPYLPKRNPF